MKKIACRVVLAKKTLKIRNINMNCSKFWVFVVAKGSILQIFLWAFEMLMIHLIFNSWMTLFPNSPCYSFLTGVLLWWTNLTFCLFMFPCSRNWILFCPDDWQKGSQNYYMSEGRQLRIDFNGTLNKFTSLQPDILHPLFRRCRHDYKLIFGKT